MHSNIHKCLPGGKPVGDYVIIAALVLVCWGSTCPSAVLQISKRDIIGKNTVAQVWRISKIASREGLSSSDSLSFFHMYSTVYSIVSQLGDIAWIMVNFLNLFRCPPSGNIFVPFPLAPNLSQPPDTTRSFILIGRNFHQWHCSTEQGNC